MQTSSSSCVNEASAGKRRPCIYAVMVMLAGEGEPAAGNAGGARAAQAGLPGCAGAALPAPARDPPHHPPPPPAHPPLQGTEPVATAAALSSLHARHAKKMALHQLE